jgi:hypothetical protein
MDYLLRCPCTHSVQRHVDVIGCKSTGCSCSLNHLEALDASISSCAGPRVPVPCGLKQQLASFEPKQP